MRTASGRNIQPNTAKITQTRQFRVLQAMPPSHTSSDAATAHIRRCINRSLQAMRPSLHHAMHQSRKSCDASITNLMRCINRSHHAMHPSLASGDASIAQIMRYIRNTGKYGKQPKPVNSRNVGWLAGAVALTASTHLRPAI